jgi:hypothetical protein
VNPFKWISKQLDRLEDLKTISMALYFVAVLIAGLPTHSYDDLMSVFTLAIVGIILSLPGSLLIGAILKLLARLNEAFFPS